MPANSTSLVVTMDTDKMSNSFSVDSHPQIPANYLDIYDNVHINKADQDTKRIASEKEEEAGDLLEADGNIPAAHNSNEVAAICSHDNQFPPSNQISADFSNAWNGDNEGEKGVAAIMDMGDDMGYMAQNMGDYPYCGYNTATNFSQPNASQHNRQFSQQDADLGQHNRQFDMPQVQEDNRPFSDESSSGHMYGEEYQRLDENENVDNVPHMDSEDNIVQMEYDPILGLPGFESQQQGLGQMEPEQHQGMPLEDPQYQSLPPLEPLNEADELGLYQAAMEGHMEAVKTLIQHGEADEVAMMSDETGEKGRTMIHAAVHAHCTDVIEVLLGHGASPDVQDADGETPLHLAVKLAFVDIVETLIIKGSNVNIEDELGRTPLQLCLNMDKPVTPSDIVMINMLIPSTDFSICDFDGISALHCLAYWDLWSQLETALALTNSGMVKDNRGRTPLHYCFMNPNHLALDAAYILIRVDASIMIKDFDGKTPMHRLMAHPMSTQNEDASRFIRDFICAEIRNNDGHSLLHLSTIGCDGEMLRFLFRCGVYMDDKDREQNSALHIAVQRNQTDMVRTLLHCGASPNAQDQQQQSPLHLAATMARISAAKLLLAESAEVDLRDERGRTALHRSVHAGSFEMSKLLLNAGANPNATDTSESIPLHYAVSQDKFEIVELLLLKKSRVNYSDIDGRTPLHLAVRTGSGDLIRILILHGALVNEYDRYGQTPLHIAAELGKSEAVQTLMNRGANENLRDSEGRKAEQVAEDKGSMRVMKVMRDHRDSMIMYSQENLVETAGHKSMENLVVGYLNKSTTSIVACVSHQALDDIDEMEDLVEVEVKKPTTNGMASLSKLESDDEDYGPCGCCRVQ